MVDEIVADDPRLVPIPIEISRDGLSRLVLTTTRPISPDPRHSTRYSL
jgi:hypothetical protein